MSESADGVNHIEMMIWRMSSSAMVGCAAKSIAVDEVVVRGLIDVMNFAHATWQSEKSASMNHMKLLANERARHEKSDKCRMILPRSADTGQRHGSVNAPRLDHRRRNAVQATRAPCADNNYASADTRHCPRAYSH